MRTGEGEAAAFMRRFYELSPPVQLEIWAAARAYLAAAIEETSADRVLEERREAIGMMRSVAAELQLEEDTAPTVRQFDACSTARATGWSSARVTKAFGRWSFACDYFLDRNRRRSAGQRAAVRASRRGVFRERDDYLYGVRLWLDSCPTAAATVDYDAWRVEYNAARPAGKPPLVSYSRLRQVFQYSWDDLKQAARGELLLAQATARGPRQQRVARHGPQDLIAFGDVREMLGLGLTAGRNLTRSTRFPKPAYTHPRGARNRLWLRSDVQRFVAGQPVPEREANHLQQLYLDSAATAEALGLATITVTTGSSPKVPQPSVSIGGLRLWLRDDIDKAKVERETISE
jgi:hypothetical protein